MLTSHGRHRYEEVDSLRGLAAMVVVFYHAIMFLGGPDARWLVLFKQSPFGLLISGPDAVLLFFVMSGFVLFLPYLRPEGSDPYGKYVVKRVCRIYLPYLAALLITVAAELLFYHSGDGMLTRLHVWERPLPGDAAWQNLLFVGHNRPSEFNPVFWSLIHEMRISLAYPLIAWLVLRVPFGLGVLGGLAICVLGFTPLHFTGVPDLGSLGFSGLFVLGAVLARYLPQVRQFVAVRGTLGRGAFLIMAVCLFKSTHLLPKRFYQPWATVPLHGMGAMLILVLALTTTHFSRFLRTGVVSWLGKVSYSLYLIHSVIFVSLASLFWDRTTHHLLLGFVGIVLSLASAGFLYRWVERPSILLGRILTRGNTREHLPERVQAPGAQA